MHRASHHASQKHQLQPSPPSGTHTAPAFLVYGPNFQQPHIQCRCVYQGRAGCSPGSTGGCPQPQQGAGCQESLWGCVRPNWDISPWVVVSWAELGPGWGTIHPITALLALEANWKKNKAFWSWSGSLSPLYTEGNYNFQQKARGDLFNSVWIRAPLPAAAFTVLHGRLLPFKVCSFFHQPPEENHFCGLFGFPGPQSLLLLLFLNVQTAM